MSWRKVSLKYYLIQNPSESAKERRGGGLNGVASELEVVKMNFWRFVGKWWLRKWKIVGDAFNFVELTQFLVPQKHSNQSLFYTLCIHDLLSVNLSTTSISKFSKLVMVHLVKWKHSGSLLQNALETGLLLLTVIQSLYDETRCVNGVLKSIKFGEHLWLL